MLDPTSLKNCIGTHADPIVGHIAASFRSLRAKLFCLRKKDRHALPPTLYTHLNL